MAYTPLSTSTSDSPDNLNRGVGLSIQKGFPLKMMLGSVFVIATLLAVIVTLNTRKSTSNKAFDQNLTSTECLAQSGQIKSSCSTQEKQIGTVETENMVCCQQEVATQQPGSQGAPSGIQQGNVSTVPSSGVAPTGSQQASPTAATDAQTPIPPSQAISKPTPTGSPQSRGGGSQDGGDQCVPLITVIKKV